MAIIKFMWCEIIKQILADMRHPLQYVPWALVIVVLGLVVTIVLSEKKDGKKASVRFFRILFAIYILVVIQITFFSREPGSRNGCMNLDLFSTWGYSVVTHAFFIENILMTVPFGILAPLCFRRLRPMWKCVVLGGVCSVLTELSQYVTKRGYCEVDDMLTNTIGVLCGCILLWLIELIIKQRRKK